MALRLALPIKQLKFVGCLRDYKSDDIRPTTSQVGDDLKQLRRTRPSQTLVEFALSFPNVLRSLIQTFVALEHKCYEPRSSRHAARTNVDSFVVPTTFVDREGLEPPASCL